LIPENGILKSALAELGSTTRSLEAVLP
jgi:hypothetical protein